MTVLPAWIDFNGHMNMAYYSVLFDQGVDQAYEQIGFGPEYQKTGFTTYVAEFHICYLRELHEGDATHVTTRLLGHRANRFHVYQELFHSDGWRAATAEGLTLHVDQSGPRVAPMPQAIQSRLSEILTVHAALPAPDMAGRRVSLDR